MLTGRGKKKMQMITNWDLAALDALQTIHNAFLNYFLAVFTYMGAGGLVWIVLALSFMSIKKTRRLGMTCAAGLISELLFNEILIKNLVKRTRPFILNPGIDTIVTRPSSYSFPSGHSCTAFVAATVIFCYNKKWGVAAYVVSALIAFSRNYFYIHYPTDVIVGALEGILIGIVTTKLMEKFFEHRDGRQTAEGEQEC